MPQVSRKLRLCKSSIAASRALNYAKHSTTTCAALVDVGRAAKAALVDVGRAAKAALVDVGRAAKAALVDVGHAAKAALALFSHSEFLPYFLSGVYYGRN